MTLCWRPWTTLRDVGAKPNVGPRKHNRIVGTGWDNRDRGIAPVPRCVWVYGGRILPHCCAGLAPHSPAFLELADLPSQRLGQVRDHSWLACISSAQSQKRTLSPFRRLNWAKSGCGSAKAATDLQSGTPPSQRCQEARKRWRGKGWRKQRAQDREATCWYDG